MASIKPPSNPLALAVLVVLFERPMHPYEIAATLRMRHVEKSIKLRYGSLYTVIESLHQQGLIAVKGTVREGKRPERTVYELAPAGAERMRAWLRELIGTPVKEYPQFEAALALLGAVPPDEAVTLLEARAARLAEKAEELRATFDTVTRVVEPLFLVEMDYRLAMVEAERRFIEAFLRRVKEDESYVRTWKAFHAGPSGRGPA
jgi:DNA-binding PadR family transcriptional regulator